MSKDQEIGISTLPDVVQVSYEMVPNEDNFLFNISDNIKDDLPEVNSHKVDDIDYDESDIDATRVPQYSNDDNERHYLTRTLSAIKNSIESSNLDSTTSSNLSNKVMEIADEFHKTGNSNDVALSKLMDEIKSLKTDDGSRILKIEFEEAVENSISTNLYNKILEDTHGKLTENLLSRSSELGYADTEAFEKLSSEMISVKKYLELLVESGKDISELSKILDESKNSSLVSNSYFSDIMSDPLNRMDESQLLKVNEYKDLYSSGDISREQLIERIRSTSDSFSDPESDDSLALDELAVILKSIEENTNPDNNELSNAERILENNRYDLEKENNELLSEVLNGISSRDNNEVTKGLLEGVTSAEQAGEAVVDSALDWLLGDDGGGDIYYEGGDDDRRDRRNRRNPRNRRGPRRGPSSGPRIPAGSSRAAGLLTLGSKAAVPLAVAANVGMAGYEYFNAEDQLGRNEAVGEGVGGTVGAIGGAKVGALAGAAVGSFVPIVGTAVGAAVGGILGAIGGSLAGSSLGKKVSGWFSDITDIIPDEVKEAGPINELDYIDRVMMPALEADLANSNSAYKDSDKKDLIAYRQELIDEQIPSSVENQIKTADLDTADVQARMNFVKEYYGALRNANPELYLDILSSLPDEYSPMVETEIQQVRESQSADWTSGNSSRQPRYSDATGSSAPPVSYDPTSVGSVAEKYESGGRGVSTVSSGRDDPGGVSYGKYQLASKTGTMQAFLNSEEGAQFKDQFRGLRPGTRQFNEVYERIARENPEDFNAAQHAFIGRTHFNPVADIATEMGFDTENKAIQEALWSQSVQHGRSGNRSILENVKNSGVDMDDQEAVIREIYNQRAQYVAGLSSVPDSTRRSILNRYDSEVSDVLAVNRMHQNTPETEMLASTDDSSIEMDDQELRIRSLAARNGNPDAAKYGIYNPDTGSLFFSALVAKSGQSGIDLMKSTNPNHESIKDAELQLEKQGGVPISGAQSPVLASASSSSGYDDADEIDPMSSNELTDDEKQLVAHYQDQGMENLGGLSMATGIPADRLRSHLDGGGSVLANRSGDLDVSDLEPIESFSNNQNSNQPIVISQGGGTASSPSLRDEYRISDDSVSLAALMT